MSNFQIGKWYRDSINSKILVLGCVVGDDWETGNKFFEVINEDSFALRGFNLRKKLHWAYRVHPTVKFRLHKEQDTLLAEILLINSFGFAYYGELNES